MSEKLYTAKEWRKARADWKRENPAEGDYWYGEMFIPILVVLAVHPNHVTICSNTQETDAEHWTWDLDKPRIVSREEFKAMIADRFCDYGGSHDWAARMFLVGEKADDPKCAEPVPVNMP
jgi:hypothetical protein